ncbi:hypothetical protein HPB50_012701 [Hyalomma asiaticum]|uniref:Uncharacterized protein n=1 Tax=Hyalomma asiaticum TaxID=266040 RepID=A0ACB7T453_HYAAI|nr:hypothetical protein HPB50_012701 [Hyalomma asiaticum]
MWVIFAQTAEYSLVFTKYVLPGEPPVDLPVNVATGVEGVADDSFPGTLAALPRIASIRIAGASMVGVAAAL